MTARSRYDLSVVGAGLLLLVDDFVIEDGPASLHVLNAPSPAATSCLAIGSVIAERAFERFGL